MKRMSTFLRFHLSFLAISIALSASGWAQEAMEIDLGAFGGYNWLSKTSELGDAKLPTDVPDNAGLIGARASFHALNWLGVEGEFKFAFSKLRSGAGTDDVVGLRGHLIASLPMESAIRPFITVGFGAERLTRALNTAIRDWDSATVLGVGARYDMLRHFGVRVDGRLLVIPGRSGLTTDYEAMAGIYLRLNTPAGDSDKDGINDDDDKCPNDPEDRDGFEDADGCPDPDNDGDGIADGADKCPSEPETKNGFEDEDGCPDVADDDRDGIPNDKDKCPDKPETKNGFEDEDGCPDELDKDGDGVMDRDDKCPDKPETRNGFEDEDGCPDTLPDQDADGIPDKDDKCPSEAETKNGFEDNDGCPDELPSKLKKSFSGTIKGIVFDVLKATIKKPSFKVLDAAVALMQEFPEIRVEVSGHTDNSGTEEANKKLSQERADAVKAYMVGKGVAEGRIVAVGHGSEKPIADNKKPAGKAKNRRIEFNLL